MNSRMDPFELRRIGNTHLQVPRLGFGGAPLGDRLEEISEEQAEATVEAAYACGVRYFDTSPWYGNGKSELRLGRVLRPKSRESFALTTKVGRVFFRPRSEESLRRHLRLAELRFDFHFDYTRAGVLRSYEQSLMRLGFNTVDALLIHDLDLGHFGTEEAVEERFQELEAGGGYAALRELKESGEIRAIGAGINYAGMIPRFLKRFGIDFFLVAMPYTLLNQEALEPDLRLCRERGVSVVIGAVFSSGILATGPSEGARYRYAPAPGDVREKAARIRSVCDRHEVPLGAAALQFPLGHPTVVSVIPGANTPEQVRQNLAWLQHPIPPDLWNELKAEGLLAPDAPAPGTNGS